MSRISNGPTSSGGSVRRHAASALPDDVNRGIKIPDSIYELFLEISNEKSLELLQHNLRRPYEYRY